MFISRPRAAAGDVGEEGGEEEHPRQQEVASSSPSSSPSLYSFNLDQRRIPGSVPSPIRRPRGGSHGISPLAGDSPYDEAESEEVFQMRAWVGSTSHLLFHCPMEQEDLASKRALTSEGRPPLDSRPANMETAPASPFKSFGGGLVLRSPVHRNGGLFGAGRIVNDPKAAVTNDNDDSDNDDGVAFPSYINQAMDVLDVSHSADDLQHVPTQESAAIQRIWRRHRGAQPIPFPMESREGTLPKPSVEGIGVEREDEQDDLRSQASSVSTEFPDDDDDEGERSVSQKKGPASQERSESFLDEQATEASLRSESSRRSVVGRLLLGLSNVLFASKSQVEEEGKRAATPSSWGVLQDELSSMNGGEDEESDEGEGSEEESVGMMTREQEEMIASVANLLEDDITSPQTEANEAASPRSSLSAIQSVEHPNNDKDDDEQGEDGLEGLMGAMAISQDPSADDNEEEEEEEGRREQASQPHHSKSQVIEGLLRASDTNTSSDAENGNMSEQGEGNLSASSSSLESESGSIPIISRVVSIADGSQASHQDGDSGGESSENDNEEEEEEGEVSSEEEEEEEETGADDNGKGKEDGEAPDQEDTGLEALLGSTSSSESEPEENVSQVSETEEESATRVVNDADILSTNRQDEVVIQSNGNQQVDSASIGAAKSNAFEGSDSTAASNAAGSRTGSILQAQGSTSMFAWGWSTAAAILSSGIARPNAPPSSSSSLSSGASSLIAGLGPSGSESSLHLEEASVRSQAKSHDSLEQEELENASHVSDISVMHEEVSSVETAQDQEIAVNGNMEAKEGPSQESYVTKGWSHVGTTLGYLLRRTQAPVDSDESEDESLGGSALSQAISLSTGPVIHHEPEEDNYDRSLSVSAQSSLVDSIQTSRGSSSKESSSQETEEEDDEESAEDEEDRDNPRIGTDPASVEGQEREAEGGYETSEESVVREMLDAALDSPTESDKEEEEDVSSQNSQSGTSSTEASMSRSDTKAATASRGEELEASAIDPATPLLQNEAQHIATMNWSSPVGALMPDSILADPSSSPILTSAKVSSSAGVRDDPSSSLRAGRSPGRRLSLGFSLVEEEDEEKKEGQKQAPAEVKGEDGNGSNASSFSPSAAKGRPDSDDWGELFQGNKGAQRLLNAGDVAAALSWSNAQQQLTSAPTARPRRTLSPNKKRGGRRGTSRPCISPSTTVVDEDNTDTEAFNAWDVEIAAVQASGPLPHSASPCRGRARGAAGRSSPTLPSSVSPVTRRTNEVEPKDGGRRGIVGLERKAVAPESSPSSSRSGSLRQSDEHEEDKEEEEQEEGLSTNVSTITTSTGSTIMSESEDETSQLSFRSAHVLEKDKVDRPTLHIPALMRHNIKAKNGVCDQASSSDSADEVLVGHAITEAMLDAFIATVRVRLICQAFNTMKYFLMSKEQRHAKAAAVIQGLARGYSVREECRSLKRATARTLMTVADLDRQREAAEVIQHHVRGRQIRRQYVKIRSAVVMFQCIVRSRLRRIKAAVYLQACSRARGPRIAFIAHMRTLPYRKATSIQRIARGVIVRRGFCSSMTAVVTIQHHTRDWLRRRRAYALRGLIILQSLYRGRRARRAIASLHTSLRQKKAAIRIQAMVRGRECRHLFASACLIANWIQWHFRHRRAERQRAKSAAVCHIQHLILGKIIHQRFIRMRAAACLIQPALRSRRNIHIIDIQSAWRRWASVRAYTRMCRAALCLHRWSRNRVYRLRYLAGLSVVASIQRKFRLWRAKINAAIRLQKWWRKCIAMHQYNTCRVAAIRIQSWLRGCESRRQCVEENDPWKLMLCWTNTYDRLRHRHPLVETVVMLQDSFRHRRNQRVLMIQMAYRRYLTKKQGNALRAAKAMENERLRAVIKVQSLIRGAAGRREVQQKRNKVQDLQLRNKAVLTIQRRERGISRQEKAQSAKAQKDLLLETKQRHDGSVLLQRVVRGYLARIAVQYRRTMMDLAARYVVDQKAKVDAQAKERLRAFVQRWRMRRAARYHSILRVVARYEVRHLLQAAMGILAFQRMWRRKYQLRLASRKDAAEEDTAHRQVHAGPSTRVRHSIEDVVSHVARAEEKILAIRQQQLLDEGSSSSSQQGDLLTGRDALFPELVKLIRQHRAVAKSLEPPATDSKSTLENPTKGGVIADGAVKPRQNRRPSRLMALLKRRASNTMTNTTLESFEEGHEQEHEQEDLSTSEQSQFQQDRNSGQGEGGAGTKSSFPRSSSFFNLGGWLRQRRTESMEDGKVRDGSGVQAKEEKEGHNNWRARASSLLLPGRRYSRAASTLDPLFETEAEKGVVEVPPLTKFCDGQEEAVLLQSLEAEGGALNEHLEQVPYRAGGDRRDSTLVLQQQRPQGRRQDSLLDSSASVGQTGDTGDLESTQIDISSSYQSCAPFTLFSLLSGSPVAPRINVPLLLEAQQNEATVDDESGDAGDSLPTTATGALEQEASNQPHSAIPTLGSVRIVPTPEKKMTASQQFVRALNVIKKALDPLPPEPTAATPSATAHTRNPSKSQASPQHPSIRAVSQKKQDGGAAESRPASSSRNRSSLRNSRKASNSASSQWNAGSASAFSAVAFPSREVRSSSHRTQGNNGYQRPSSSKVQSYSLRKERDQNVHPYYSDQRLQEEMIGADAETRKLWQTNRKMDQALQENARVIYRDIEESKEFWELLVDYEGHPNDEEHHRAREASLFYRQQCERLNASLEGLAPWKPSSGDWRNEDPLNRSAASLSSSSARQQQQHYSTCQLPSYYVSTSSRSSSRQSNRSSHIAVSDTLSMFEHHSRQRFSGGAVPSQQLTTTRTDLGTSSDKIEKSVSNQIKTLLYTIEKSPRDRHLVSTSFSVLQYYTSNEKETRQLMTSAKAQRIIWETLRYHVEANEIIEDGLRLLMNLTDETKDLEKVRRTMPAYGIQLLTNLKYRENDLGNPLIDHDLRTLVARLG